MRRRTSRLGKRSITRAVRRSRPLPAPGFLAMEDGTQFSLTPVKATLDHVPHQLINRPARPGSGVMPVRLDAGTTLWLRAAQGPSVN